MFDPNAGTTAPILATSPVRMFHGIPDDSVPIQPRRDFVVRLKAANQGVVLKEYPDTWHALDGRDGTLTPAVADNATDLR